jgi:hypothetical protein
MRSATVKPTLAALGLSMMLCVPVVAHHAFSAEFDPQRPVKLQGKVLRMEWINPHAWIHLEVAEPAQLAGTWRVEGGTPNTLYRRGFSKTSLEPGTVIVVNGYQAKDGSMTANGRDVTFPDGRKLFLGSSGTGAPRDGADPTEPTQQ